MDETFISLNGHRTRVQRSGGHGPAVMFLHGFPEWSGAWESVFAHIDGLQCFAPDQRGYGISHRPAEIDAYTGGRLARDVLDLIEALGLGRVHLVGHDWGASVAYACVFSKDPRIASLTILNGVHPIPFQRALARGGAQTNASQYIPWLRRPGSETILAEDRFARLASLFSKSMDMTWLSGTRLDAYRAAWRDEDTVRAMVNWYRASPLVVPPADTPLAPDQIPDWFAERMQVQVPHLLIWGLGDTALLPEARTGLEEFCADLTLHEIDGADHWLHHQKPAEVASLISDFVKQHD